ncbi:LPD7 domain-containing protein [Hydrogenophaga sp.]|uniref:LPD7 domain-containing protein n=1 Tax=Hydrogenophaga sp. TaxID=1904254 RepID=UPI002BEC408B|nr:LPD7 domain-containing protein [Hydrogenophaga sp.]HMP09506.1 hypothetical protein [Hydrogenophaga sp.]
MSDAPIPRFTLEYRLPTGSGVLAKVGYNDPEKALQAYRDASESFRASNQPPGATLSLTDEKMELHGGAVAEGRGSILHGWFKESARERFAGLKPSQEARPELEPMRAALAEKRAVDQVRSWPERTGGGAMQGLERKTVGDRGARIGRSAAGVEKPENKDALRKRYLITTRGYHDKQTTELVIQVKGDKLETQREDTATIDALATAAADRGWTTVKLSGTDAFRREAWYQLAARGIESHGYQPTPADKARLADVEQARVQGLNGPAGVGVAAATGVTNAREADASKHLAAYKASPVSAVSRTAQAVTSTALSPEQEAADAVRRAAPEIAPNGPEMSRDGLTLSAAANAAHGAAVAANERNARAASHFVGNGVLLQTAPAASGPKAELTGDRKVMVEAVVRVAREGGLNGDKLDRVRDAATKVAASAYRVKAPQVADRSAIPQPTSPGPKPGAYRDLSR